MKILSCVFSVELSAKAVSRQRNICDESAHIAPDSRRRGGPNIVQEATQGLVLCI